MRVRNWAVGVVSTAVVVAGVVAVQSGIPGTAALPVLPHRADAPVAPGGGAELPAPAEVGAPPPGAGAVRTAPAGAGVMDVLPGHRPAAAHRPGKRPRPPGGKADDGKGAKDSPDHSGKDSDPRPAPDGKGGGHSGEG